MADYRSIITGTIASIVDKVKEAADSEAVRSVYEQGTSKAKAYGQLARYTFEVNGDKEELKRVFCEIGKLCFEQSEEAPNEFYAPLFEKAQEISQRIAEKEEYIRSVKSEFASRTAGDVEVEVCDFEEIVNAAEEDAAAEVTSAEPEKADE